MSKHPTFHLHEKADSDLGKIFDYSVEQFGFARAERYVYDIEQAFKDLAANPKLGRRFDPDEKRYFQISLCFLYAHRYRGRDLSYPSPEHASYASSLTVGQKITVTPVYVF